MGVASLLAGFRTSRSIAIGILVTLTGVVLVMPLMMSRINAPQPTPTMLYAQDLVLLPLFCVAALIVGPDKLPPREWPSAARRRGWWLAFAAVTLCGICIWGHQLVFWGIDFSRDEQMATFDAAIFRSGHLAAPILPAWRGIAPALNLLFILPIGDHAAWVSSYLPVNAALRALVALVADPVVTSPLFVVVGLLALASIARRLWPASPGSQLAALLCYLGSSQIVITGMTAYAMSAHLAFNLIWLLLFLRGDRIGFVGTLLVGFLATGVHQPLFHPLFVLPFVLDLLRQRRWRRCVAYSAGYALIAGFWVAWPVWMSGYAGPVPVANDREGIDYVTRLLHMTALIRIDGLWTMSANLIRFITWQHVLLLPLMVMGVVGGWRRWTLVRPLAIGFVLPILVMGILLPWQAHGWGYRYLHPVLGNACLLAGYGWHRIEQDGLDLRRSMRWAAVVSLLLLPVHGWMARRMVAVQAIPTQHIARLQADVILIDTALYSADLVINAPDLGNRPVRLNGSALRQTDIAPLCRGRRIAFVDAPRLAGLNAYYDAERLTQPTAHQLALRRAAHAAGCTIVSG